MDEEWYPNSGRCACGGCLACYTAPIYGEGCFNARRKEDRLLEPHNMRCDNCAKLRDKQNGGKGQSAGKGKSSTGSGAAAGSASWDDHPRIAEQREVAALRRNLNQLSSDFAKLVERVERLEGWQR